MYSKKALLAGLLFIGIATSSFAQKQPKEPFTKEEWVRDYEPFRVAGNLYYVGSEDLGCYLITTPKGHILINTGVSSSMPMLQRHIETLGFKVKDIKILLTSQVHFDHVGAMAEMKKVTGAKLMVEEADASVMADGGASDYLYAQFSPMFAPAKPDRILKNGDKVELGGITITVLHHPGHTKGSCSFVFTVNDGKKKYDVLIANMPSVIVEKKMADVHTYPGMEKDYVYTFAAMRKLKFDIWMAAHSSQCGLQDKRKPGDKYNPEAFRDQKGYLEELDQLEKGFKEKR